MLKESFFSPEYLVSDEGYVLSKKTHRPLKYSVNPHGYAIINAMVNGKQTGFAVHKVVAMAFCPGYQKDLQVNHKDGDKLNNNANNLEWITAKENNRHATRILGRRVGVLNYKHKAVDMCDKDSKKVIRHFECYRDAARFLRPNADFNQLTSVVKQISRVVVGYRKTYCGYIWRTTN